LNSKVRPEARQVLKKFIDAGLQVKILSSQNAERVLWTVKSMGWETAGLKTISGLELGKIEQRDLPDRIHSTMLFCELSPAQKASIIESLQKQGEYVAMVGDNVNDVPSMLKANLRFALRSSVQAALSLTDIVLIRDSLDALPSILTTGQRLVNSVVDTFKLYLSQVISQLIMIVAVLFFGFRHFPFNSTQGGIISAFTIALPNIILSAWSAAGMLSGAEIRRRLLRFIIPSSITLSILSFAVFELFWRLNLPAVFPPKLLQNLQVTDARLFYAQMAVTFALLFAGWLRLLFLQPPTQFWVGGAPLRGDSRVYYVVLGVAGLLVVFIIFPFLPFQEWLRVTWLPRFQDYLLIGAFVIIWCFILRAIWRINWIGVTRKVFSQSIERKGITVSHEKAKIEAVR
jgi:cation-transporting ATPase E